MDVFVSVSVTNKQWINPIDYNCELWKNITITKEKEWKDFIVDSVAEKLINDNGLKKGNIVAVLVKKINSLQCLL